MQLGREYGLRLLKREFAMKNRTFGKLQLNRETLRHLDNGELERVVGGITSYREDCTTGCYGNSNSSDCVQACAETATCDCNSETFPTASHPSADTRCP